MAKRFASQVPGYSYDGDRFFSCDGAPADIQSARRTGFAELAATLNARHQKSIALTKQARERISDLQFTGAYRVPFQFSRYVREHFSIGAFLDSAEGVSVTDLDGERLIDLTGSYGVNVFGHDFYKSCMAEGSARAAGMGMVLGSCHPSVAWNAEELCRISGMDEVSFHMSGTEAVMQAVRLARYHTRRKKIVRFCGAYHGWWDDVQPGPGNPMPPGRVYTLQEMSGAALQVLRKRRDVACVLVNPLQGLHPNKAAPGDGTLVDSSRSAHFDREAYTRWLQQLREACTANGIVLIFDEVFLGFRLALGGAQEYFGVKADMVTYGKTLGGGFPVGVVCGKRHLMKRYRDDRPGDICFARGTFNSHPHVMAAMQVFLERVQTPSVQALYAGLDGVWNSRAEQLNQRLLEAGLPVTVSNLSTIWTVSFTRASRYNWMYQFYLRAHGLALSWVGTGRLVFSLNFTDEEFAEVSERIIAAAKAMQAAGWWWQDASLTNKSIKRGVLREMLRHRFQ
ncbi:glutamate-1-semialdehyde 2,1-aminomutase [Roseimicrobium gellanilyticum]|uniref:Glutamate-1-semialdehyde 2,1-aminomutase n=2 Tax=Roseimicrobium gellanilyticum TaxID=748857 RepID=A0A366HQV2_9BACT|nr:glutamate-1-semialdehyde 2,1-aminomutase [Roseimicrobium gellanilyticum]